MRDQPARRPQGLPRQCSPPQHACDELATPRVPAPPAAMSALPYCLPYVVPLMTVAAQYSRRPWHALVPPVFVWFIIPLADAVVRAPRPTQRLSHGQRVALEDMLSFRLVIYLWCPVQLAVLFWAAARVAHPAAPVDGLRLVGLVWSVALIAAEGINCSHELLHRRASWERFLGKLLLVSVSYGHFTIEHARGHHRNVATPNDPATLHFGESFYHFLPKTLFYSYRSAWALESARLRRRGLPVFCPQNEMLWYAAGSAAYVVLFYFVFGPRAVALFASQSVFAVLLLEQINAIEHYGLARRKLPSGGYEPVGPRHSWDAPQLVSNYLLFKLQRHADHHLHASRRFQVLELTEESPQLPAGYLTLAPLLFIPPLWRLVMDPILLSYKEMWQCEERAQALAAKLYSQQEPEAKREYEQDVLS